MNPRILNNLSNRCFCGFRPACWHVVAHSADCAHPDRVPTWRGLQTKLWYKYGQIISPNTSHIKNCTYLKLDEGLCIITSFSFPDSRIYVSNSFHILIFLCHDETRSNNDGDGNENGQKVIIGLDL